ncbi:hypothetical protein [Solibacillus daqui]|uniref:hypothetical protein n=1 Tax=Solibacillus daqui TaxID=2912187 RepID=UPI002366998A|nr:hypothetical protein [Solibacillus daqui]
MIEINGKFTDAKIYTNRPQQVAIEQIDELVNQSFMSGTKVRIMPDYHVGKGCVDKTWILIKPTVHIINNSQI